ncbi:rhamnogalacturonan acetylesterase [Chitinophaga agrisoli]|uniref:Rhamnogalacturonan acetylesterase n=1 Tax=Chitinophaga agrisoli TaxID=2607653 RepID=A0A5B2VLQ3_9BACT|nr:rhamnogalacturonan acetylesterase [Chitinophaga agrisoli]KAA2239835.1 rhamnogalacturonan acetylesterase [Chitinophaga agrisoli]
MKITDKKILLVVLFCMTTAFIAPPQKIHVWLIGDSTVCDQPLDRSPVTGWGTPFAGFFDSSVAVINKARGGRSTRTFISEGRWQEVADSLQEGDYVLIQFGHNDEAKEPRYRDRYTPVPDYKNNLARFIREARGKKAQPVLITPVTRLSFDSTGHVKETHREYSAAVWEIGRQYNVPVIDLDTKSRQLADYFGPKYAKVLYMQVDSLENPHYPAGRKDNTHFNEYGARRIAELVLAAIRERKMELAERITKKVAP